MEDVGIPKDLKCEECGQKDFYRDNDNGFLICNECGTQSQAVKELAGTQIADNEFNRFQKHKVIKKTKEKKEKDVLNQLTSWECFNYILVGLVDELIKLGASSTFKKTVHTLWMKYLIKLEALRVDALPKLGFSTWKKDATILYGYKEKKAVRCRAKYKYEDADSMSKEGLKYLQKKHRKSVIMENYQNCTLLDKTDGSIMDFEPENVLNSTTKLEYHSSITRELEKGLKRKRSDNDDSSLNPLTPSKTISASFRKGAENLTRGRIFSIIYISLLIGNEEIQLADLLRFIREGHVSYVKVEQFFPSSIKKEDFNIPLWRLNSSYLNHKQHREATLKLAQYLEVAHHIPCQNLVRLCKRYCKEMNLPTEISDYIINLMAKLSPKMGFNMTPKDSRNLRDNLIPNYEGRVMSLIMFSLKLMFGLDDKTENHLSTYAQMLNEREDIEQKMFVWRDWIYYIHYRKLIIMQHHFSTQFVFDSEGVNNVNLNVDFLANNILKNDDFDLKNEEDEVLNEILEQLHQKECDDNINFSASLVPFRDYVQVLLWSKIPNRKGYLTEVLNSNFEETSLKFLTDCDRYLEKLKKNTRVSVKERLAYEEVHIFPLENLSTEVDWFKRNSSKEVSAKITGDDDDVPTKTKNEDGSYVVFHYPLESNPNNSSFSKKSKYTHYKPCKTYWNTTLPTFTGVTRENVKVLIRSLPDSFQLVLNECARIIEQPPDVLIEEFLQVEAFLCCISDFENFDLTGIAQHDQISKNLINKAVKYW